MALLTESKELSLVVAEISVSIVSIFRGLARNFALCACPFEKQRILCLCCKHGISVTMLEQNPVLRDSMKLGPVHQSGIPSV